MRKTIFILIFLAISCAALDKKEAPPDLSRRTLRLSEDDGIPGFEYQWKECARNGIFGCREWKIVKEVYDLRDPETKKKLLHMGFVLRVREKLVP